MANLPRTDGCRWPILRAFGAVTPRALGLDLAAGLTLAAIAIPEQMATARLGGFAPQIGLIAFVAATLGFAVFGASRVLSTGADSTITPIFAGSLALMAAAGSARYAELASVLALMTGVILVVAGWLKLGWIADLLSRPVTTGFLAGIALLIVLSQTPAALGLPEESGDIYQRLAALAAHAGQVRWTAVAIGLGVFAVTWAAEKADARIPGALIGVVGASVIAIRLGLARRGLAVLGDIPSGIPRPRLPSLGLETLLPLVGLAAVVALVVMVQTAATSRSFCAEDDEPDVDRDYVGVGVASLLAGLFGAFPVNASPPRTAAVAETGGRSQYAGLAAAAGVLLLAALGTGILAQTPTAALAGVLLFVALRIFRVRDFAEIFRRAPTEFALALMTTTLICALPIQTGAAIGVFLSLAHGVFTITRAQLIAFERVPGTTVWWPADKARPGETLEDVRVMGFQAPLCFLNAYALRRGLLAALDGGAGATRLFVFEASSVAEMDFTAAGVLTDMIDKARGRGIEFAVARLESVRAQAAFDRFGITQRLGQDHLFHSVEQAIQTLTKRPPAPTANSG
jgi:MFS superfamily sulfate permease-like transporter